MLLAYCLHFRHNGLHITPETSPCSISALDANTVLVPNMRSPLVPVAFLMAVPDPRTNTYDTSHNGLWVKHSWNATEYLHIEAVRYQLPLLQFLNSLVVECDYVSAPPWM